jgi:hypothetical protein
MAAQDEFAMTMLSRLKDAVHEARVAVIMAPSGGDNMRTRGWLEAIEALSEYIKTQRVSRG